MEWNRQAYLTLLKKALTFSIYEYIDGWDEPKPREIKPKIMPLGATERGLRNCGRDWPSVGESMIGTQRMDNIAQCLESALKDGIEGDVIEAGVWRGGASIFMRGILNAYNSSKQSYVADSFEGLPEPDAVLYPQDARMNLHTYAHFLACSLDKVKANFERYGLLDERVTFLKGWFKDTLSTLQDKTWCLVRLDGDMYESTMQSLEALYPNLQRGGYLIQDDYKCITQARQATDDYRAKYGITEPIQHIDWAGVWWRKEN